MDNIADQQNHFAAFREHIADDETVFPKIQDIQDLFTNINEKDFIKLVNSVITSNDDQLFKQLLYYIMLFRDMKNIKDFVNSDKTDIALIERLVLFSYSYCLLYDYSIEYVVDNMLSFVDSNKLLALVLNSKLIADDKLLLFFILSKFPFETLNQYFATIQDIPGFINYFLKLPEEILHSIVSRNYRLFQYIMLMMAEEDVDHSFLKKHKKDIEMFGNLNELLNTYKVATNPLICDPEMNREASPVRIAYLVNMLKSTIDIRQAVLHFEGENVYKSVKEKTIVTAIVVDPFLKNIYKDKTTETNF